MKKSPFAKIAIIVVAALVIPVLSYSVFQFVQSDENEELLKSIYERQLDSILFSVNQHCWDIFASWSAELTASVKANRSDNSRKLLAGFLRQGMLERSAVVGSFLQLPASEIECVWRRGYGRPVSVFEPAGCQARVKDVIDQFHPAIERMVRRAREGYVKPEAVSWNGQTEASTTLLIFPILPTSNAIGPVALAGLFVDDLEFVNEIVARKFSAMNNGNFVFAVKNRKAGNLLFSTDEESESEEFEKSEALWILPNLDLQIKLSGTTLDEISSSRTHMNLFVLGMVNVVLILGVIYVLRNISTEMALANMKTDFVANVSHELRTPLAHIRMFAETLEMERVRPEEKKREYYRTIVNESARLSQLINNILDFSKIESRKKEYYFAGTDLSQLVLQAVEMIRFHLDRKDFKLELDLEPNLPAVEIDPEAVTQALVNLLDNAVKFSPEDKRIRIRLRQQSDKIILSVQDHGIGIPEPEQKKILEKFYRAGSSLVHNTKGSGLGLSLVKHIMEVHRGEVAVKSKPGEGSTFSLIFPRNANPRA